MSLLKSLFCWLLVVLANVGSGSIIPMTVDWDDDTVEMYNSIREVTIDLIGIVPVVGDIAGVFLDLFWPTAEGEDDTMETIFAIVTKLIDQKILENDINEFQGQFDGINGEMSDYHGYLDEGKFFDAAIALDDAIDICNQIKDDISEHAYPLEFIPMMVPLSTLHLVNLREKYLFGDKFSVNNKRTAEESLTDKTNLNETYNFYKNWFNSTYGPWYDQRVAQVVADCENWLDTENNVYSYWSVTDQETGAYTGDRTASGTANWKCDHKKRWEAGSKMAMINEIQNYQMHLLSPTFYLHRYVPWLVNDTSLFDLSSNRTKGLITDAIPKTISFGPYAVADQTILAGYWDSDTAKIDEPGIVTAITGNSGSIIDFMKLKYLDHDGEHAGDEEGGEPYHVAVNYEDSWITAFNLQFGRGVISAMNITFNNGTWAFVGGEYNDKSMNCTMDDDDWVLTSIAQIGGDVKDRDYDGIKVIRLDFTHIDYVVDIVEESE